MKEIKLVFSKGGRVKIHAAGQKGQGTAQFTEKLAKDLGLVEERHRGEAYEDTHTDQQAKQET